MGDFKFTYDDRVYILNEDNCSYFLNDEEAEVQGIDRNVVLGLLGNSNEVVFEMEYYDGPCQVCKEGIKEKSKFFKFLEYHFYIFTKDNKFVISNISSEYEGKTFNRLLKKGIVDNSFIVSIMVCANCGEYSIEIEQCEV